jgi:hypothetical protein
MNIGFAGDPSNRAVRVLGFGRRAAVVMWSPGCGARERLASSRKYCVAVFISDLPEELKQKALTVIRSGLCVINLS